MFVCLELHHAASVMSGENIVCSNEETGLLVGKRTMAAVLLPTDRGTGGSTRRLGAEVLATSHRREKRAVREKQNTQTPMRPQAIDCRRTNDLGPQPRLDNSKLD